MGEIPGQINWRLTHSAPAWTSLAHYAGALQGYKETVREVTAEEPSIHVYLQAHS